MNPEHLRALLEQLHGELAQDSPLDERSRQLLLAVQDDIARLTAPPSGGSSAPSPEEHQRLRGRLQEAVVRFESAHPRLASTLEQVANALSNMGL